MKKKFGLGIAGVLLAVVGHANADFIVRDYAGVNTLMSLQTAVNNGTAPSYTSISPVVDFYANGGPTGDFNNNFAFPGNLLTNFGVDFTATLNITKADTYTFRTYSDDGVKLTIDNTVLFTDSGVHPLQYNSNTIFLTAGLHTLDLLYFQQPGGASVELSAGTGNPNSFKLVGAAGGLQTTSVPEPTTTALLGLGLLGFVASTRKLSKKDNA